MWALVALRSSGPICAVAGKLARDERLERGLPANRAEVGIAYGKRAETLRLVDREPQVLDRVGRSAGEALAASQVVEQPRILGMRLDRFTPPVGRLRVAAFEVEAVERGPDLKAFGLIRLPRGGPDREDRRPRLLCERGALHPGAGEDERAGRGVHALAVELEGRSATLDEIELFVPPGLVVLVDYPVSRLVAGPCVDAKRRDAEVVADRAEGSATVAQLVDLLKVGDGVLGHCDVVLRF